MKLREAYKIVIQKQPCSNSNRAVFSQIDASNFTPYVNLTGLSKCYRFSNQLQVIYLKVLLFIQSPPLLLYYFIWSKIK